MAVTVMLAVRFTVHVVLAAEVQPAQEEKLLELAVLGAVSVTEVPESYVRVKLVLPLPRPELSAGETLIATPLAGVVEFTVSVFRTGGVPKPLPPPLQANMPRVGAKTTNNEIDFKVIFHPCFGLPPL